MQFILIILMLVFLPSCVRGPNPIDPYEPINREIHKFNAAFDATMIRPPAMLYKNVVPGFIRTGVNNFFENINMLPTIANDILQCEFNWVIKDSWRFIANTTFGIAGIIDIASTMDLPPHNNDLGITFAKWGDRQSPYIVIPFLGPSTVRDGFGAIFNYGVMSPYPYFFDTYFLYGLLGLRLIDLRSRYLEMEPVMEQALDNYSFVRDAFLQLRNYQITGVQASDGLYIENADQTSNANSPEGLYVEE